MSDLVRIKHSDDPTARISSTISQEPDVDGGFMIPHEHLEHAKTLGWVVSHPDDDAKPKEAADEGEGEGEGDDDSTDASFGKPKLRRAKK